MELIIIGEGAERDPLDRYYTPPHVVLDLLRTPEFPSCCDTQHHVILEPCAGSGNIVNVLRWRGHEVLTGDVDKAAVRAMSWDHEWDFPSAVARHEVPEVDWIITNPPYTLKTEPKWTACDFALASFKVARVGVAFLVRQSFLEPTVERDKLFAAFPPALIYQLPRFPYGNAKGNDTASSCWVVWLRGARDWRFETKFIWRRQHELEESKRLVPPSLLISGDGYSDLPLFMG